VRVSKLHWLGLLLIMSMGAPSGAQVDPCTQDFPAMRQHGRSRATEAEDAQRDEMRRKQQQEMNQGRQESIKKDSEELLNLASQLKASVDKSSQNTLSVDVIRTAQQIEKLAKSVREKMKGNLYCDLQAH
jgi:hypothetical protein